MLTKYELDNYEGAGFIFMTPDLKLLLVKEKRSGKWGMCKGHRERCDRGDPTMTAKREAFEELGIRDTDYTLERTPFVMDGSPKIYIFQYAILKVDIITVFTNTKYNTMDYAVPRKMREIEEIKLIPYSEWMQGLEHYNSNVYVRLFQAHVTGVPYRNTFQWERERRFEEEPDIEAPTDLERLSQTKVVTPRKAYYNSQVAGGSPCAPIVSPIEIPDAVLSEPSDFKLDTVDDVFNEIGRTSPTKTMYRDRSLSSNSLLGEVDRASPFLPYPVSSGGGGAGSSPRSSPRTCASFLLPQSPSPHTPTPMPSVWSSSQLRCWDSESEIPTCGGRWSAFNSR